MHCRDSKRYFRNKGISIVEVMVAGSILTIMSVIFAGLFSQARTSSEGGTDRIAMRAIHRQAHSRLTLLLGSAIAPNEVDPGIIEPLYRESATVVRFCAPSDLIDSTEPFDPRSPDYPEFTIQMDSQTGGLVVQRSDGTGTVQLIGHGFKSVEFERPTKKLIEITLESEKTVRSAADRKKIEERSSSSVQLPGLR